jgi:YbbR domain-containing protein
MKPNLVTIILSSVFAILLWVFVSFSDEYTTTITVPIKFSNFKDGYTIQYQSDTEVTLTLKGEGWVLAQITMGPKSSFKISTDNKVGKQVINLNDALSNNPWITSSVQVVRIDPAQINYIIERISYKSVPIIPNISIGTKENYGLVSEVKLEPDTVRISGPKSIMKKLNAVITKSIVFEDLDEKVRQKVELEPINHITYENNKCVLSFDIQKIVDKSFEDVPVEVKDVPPSRELLLFPSKITVTLRGGIKMLGTLKADAIHAYVKFQNAFRDTLGVIQPTIEIPEYTKISNVEPETLEYIIKQY